MNVDKKSLETVFWIAICRGDKWQLKTLFLAIFDHIGRFLRVFTIAAYPVWICIIQNTTLKK